MCMRKLTPLLLLFISCNAVKQSTKYTNKALRYDSTTALRIFRKIAPCETTKIDTSKKTHLVTKTDTTFIEDTVSVNCPDSENVKIVRQKIIRYYNTRTRDSIFSTYYITKTVKDLTGDVENRKLQKELATTTASKNNWRLWFFILIGALLLELLFIVFLIKKPK